MNQIQEKQKTFDALFAEYPIIARYFSRFGKRPDDVEDAISRAFSILWEKWDSVQAANRRSYVYMAVRNRLIQEWRSAESKVGFFGDLSGGDWPGRDSFENQIPDPSSSVICELELSVLQDAVRRSLGALDYKKRAVLELFYLKGLSIIEISHALDMNESTVKSNMKRGKEKLCAPLGRSLGFELTAQM